MEQQRVKIIGVFVNDHGKIMMVKKAKNPNEILQFASMWNMDGLVVIGFCHQDYMYLRNHMRIPFVVYDGFCEKPDISGQKLQ